MPHFLYQSLQSFFGWNHISSAVTAYTKDMLTTANLDSCYSTVMCTWWDMQQQMRDKDESKRYIRMNCEQNQALSWHMSGRNKKSSEHESEMRNLQPRNSNCSKTLNGSPSVTPWIKNWLWSPCTAYTNNSHHHTEGRRFWRMFRCMNNTKYGRQPVYVHSTWKQRTWKINCYKNSQRINIFYIY
jgi:hypothetical protein